MDAARNDQRGSRLDHHGDLNQRRSDHTFGSWKQVFELLAIPYGDPPICRLDRGYRSTRPILRFANRLLPAAQRSVRALQEDGPEPVVEPVKTMISTSSITRNVGAPG